MQHHRCISPSAIVRIRLYQGKFRHFDEITHYYPEKRNDFITKIIISKTIQPILRTAFSKKKSKHVNMKMPNGDFRKYS